MTPERWKLIGELFNAALERKPDERDLFLDEACANDELLRNEVNSLLAAHNESGNLIDKPAYEVAADFLKDDRPESMIGRVIGLYRIKRELGQGGMGEVFLAEDIRLQRPVAIKVLPSHFSSDQDRVRRFRQEARAVSILNHPNIVTLHEIGEADGLQLIVTEYIDGKTLREYITGRKVRLTEILDIAIQTATALSAAHQAGIVHRDIKPENIMIRSDGYVKVLDFGLAKLTEQRVLQRDSKVSTLTKVSTHPGIIMGTTRYMSPEQARGQKVDALTDIFSLGVVLYEMVAGTVPFDGETSSDVIAAILSREALPLTHYAQGVPNELERIVKRAIRKQKEERYQTIKEMLGELKELKEKLELEVLQGHDSVPEFIYRRGESELESTYGDNHTGQTRAQTTSKIEYLISELSRHKKSISMVVIGLVLALGLGLGLYRSIGTGVSRQSLPFDKIEIKRLTTVGNAMGGAISPDGKDVAYISYVDNKPGLWVKQVVSGSTLQIMPPAEVAYWGLAFSPDSNFIYFIMEDPKNPTRGSLYQIAALGGKPRKLYDNVGGITFSPDGKQVAFIRNDLVLGESSLIVADTTGKNEHPIAVRKTPDSFVNSAWSPDGKQIAVTTIVSESGRAKYMALISLPANGGTEKELTTEHWPIEPWPGILGIAWLPDGKWLVLSVRDLLSGAFQIWRLSYTDGALQRITNDFNMYHGLTLTNDGNVMATTVGNALSNIWLVPNGDVSRARQITAGAGSYGQVRYTPDGRILYSIFTGEGEDIWIMNRDGSGQKQLTFEAGRSIQPTMSPDGRYILFSSNRTGSYNIWRMDSDGSNPKQLTKGSATDRYPQCSLDGKWVFYLSRVSNKLSLWKVALEGGDPVLVKETTGLPSISPDGKLIAFDKTDDRTNLTSVLVGPLEDGPILKRFEITPFCPIRWAGDGQGLIYNGSGSTSKIWYQSIGGGEPKLLADFSPDEIFSFDRSSQNKEIVCVRGRSTSDVVLITNQQHREQ